ncbi:MAG: response regulator transcription factor [Desulfohalobiaceae bacterium]|nr:response regulator transcription factor [Desulfohalobiaceae bacterium]
MKQSRQTLIIDDHPLFRTGLKAILKQETSLIVVGEAGNTKEALEIAREKRPDLVILDITLAGQNGISLIHPLREILPNVKILMLSVHSRIEYITRAFQAGADAYLLKDTASEGLLKGVEQIFQDNYFLDHTLSNEIVKNLIKSPQEPDRVSDAAYNSLTHREQEIMHLLAKGYSSKQVAKKLFISIKTVDNHRTHILNKLGLSSTIELIRYAVKIGLIDFDDWKK